MMTTFRGYKQTRHLANSAPCKLGTCTNTNSASSWKRLIFTLRGRPQYVIWCNSSVPQPHAHKKLDPVKLLPRWDDHELFMNIHEQFMFVHWHQFMNWPSNFSWCSWTVHECSWTTNGTIGWWTFHEQFSWICQENLSRKFFMNILFMKCSLKIQM